jgi:hypothetical protein
MPRPVLEKYPLELLKAEIERRAKRAGKKLKKLLKERAKLDDQISELEALSGMKSAVAVLKAKRGRKPGRKPGKKAAPKVVRRKRGTFAQNASEFVLGLVKGKGATTAEIGKKWKAAGRGGKADNALTKLVKEGKVKRTKLAEGQGSMYSLA